MNRPHKQAIAASAAEEPCPIPAHDPLYQRYHDEEWGVPVFDDQLFFEKICLEGFQSGLSWRTILHRREFLRQAFDNFNPQTIVNYGEAEIQRLLSDERIIRNRRKIVSVVNNAQRFVDMQSDSESLAELCWSFQPDQHSRPARITHAWLVQNPSTPESYELSKTLKKRGWSFVGPTNLYALMQALGIVNDHLFSCPRQKEVAKLQSADNPCKK